MRTLSVLLGTVLVVSGLLVAGCGQGAPAPAPTSPPAKAAEPAKPAQPTKAAAPAPTTAAAPAPTKAAAPATAAPTAQPTTVPAKKVDFPTKGKPITLVMPYTAGGPSDLAARMMAAGLEKELGTSVEVVNVPGAGAQVGIARIAESRPDGYTIGGVSIPTAIIYYLDTDRKATFNGQSFEYLATHGLDPVSVAVAKASPYATMKDVLDAAKANPGKLKMATTGLMSTNHVAIIKLEQLTGTRFAPVFFDGSAPLVTALAGGHVDVAIQQLAGWGGLLKSGEVRALGVWSRQESRFAPGVKTMAAQGHNLELAGIRAYLAPAKTPKEIVDVLAGAMKRVTEDKDHVKKMEDAGMDSANDGSEGLRKLWTTMETELVPLVKEAKAQTKQ